MKKAFLLALGLLCAASITLSAADAPKKREMTAEQKAVWKEILDKYDANKDGRLDKEERSKITAEDKEKMAKAGIMGGARKKEKQENK